MTHTDHVFSCGRHEVAARDWGGAGTGVVLLHGSTDNLGYWEGVVDHLVDHHRVVGVDLPGHGRSSEPSAWRWDDATAFIQCVVDQLALDYPFVVGHSLGGMVAVRYGLANPGCRGVVNVDGHGLGGPSVPAAFHEERRRLLATAPPLPVDRGDDAWLQAQIDAMRRVAESLGRDWQQREPSVRRGFDRADDGTWRRKPSNSFLHSLPDDMGPELFGIYRALKCRLLIINCTSTSDLSPFGDALVSAYRDSIAKDLAELRDDRPDVEVVDIDSGHMVMLEQPEATATALLGFMAIAR